MTRTELEKKFKQFIKDNDGKFIEVAGSANALNQCVDLANAYLRDVLNHKIVEWTNAIDFPEKLTDFEWIENEPYNIPKPGDLMIFFGQYGHISIFVKGDVNSFNSFDENYPTNSPAHIQKHNYNNVFGWLRPPIESENMSDSLQECLKQHNQLVDEANKRDKKLKTVKAELKQTKKDLETCKKQVGAYKGKVTEAQNATIKVRENLTECSLALKELQNKPPETIEAIKEPLRYVVSMAVGLVITFAYKEYPILGQLQPDQQVLIAGLVGLVVRGIDKFMHEVGKQSKNVLVRNVKIPF